MKDIFMSNPGHKAPDIAKIVERNVNALLNRKKQDQDKRSLADKIAHTIASFAGTMLSVFIHVILFGTWIAWNLGLLGLKPFDPSFIVMATFAAVEAIFLTSFVLIGQKQMNAEFDKRAELDLQVGLLTEHEVTRILTLVTTIAKTMNIEIAEDKEIEELSKDIHPGKMLDTMEKASK
ncbi:MAG TPA: DUF1003 domain-containing protein [Chitinophagaceae bacterium]|nr:DUF1003 domain-containing protein [Chitinophagaceae bacterium]